MKSDVGIHCVAPRARGGETLSDLNIRLIFHLLEHFNIYLELVSA